MCELETDVLSLLKWCTAETSAETTRLGLRIHRIHGLSCYDGVLLASALKASCDAFLSEDMKHGQRIEGVLLLNPFRHKPADLFDLVT